MREGQYMKARQGYHDVLATDANSIDAWRAYITALHNVRDEQSVLTESQRIPESVRRTLTTDAGFLTLLATAHAAAGQNDQAAELLQQARERYRSQGQLLPIGVEVQLAWTLLNGSAHQQDVPPLVAEMRARTDLDDTQRATLDEISTIWSLRAAENAFQ